MSLFLATMITTVISFPAIPGGVGGDRDAFGCIPSAGYQWCSAKQKCYRSWEESCATTTYTPTVPNCGGFQNCIAYNDGCNNCICMGGTGLTACTQRFCVPPPVPRCTACTDGYTLNAVTNECDHVEPCLMPPCVNPCGPFEWGGVNGQMPYCEGHPHTRCQGYAECNRGCYAKYFDSVTGQEIVDCTLIWGFPGGVTIM
eukprot:UN11626